MLLCFYAKKQQIVGQMALIYLLLRLGRSLVVLLLLLLLLLLRGLHSLRVVRLLLQLRLLLHRQLRAVARRVLYNWYPYTGCSLSYLYICLC